MPDFSRQVLFCKFAFLYNQRLYRKDFLPSIAFYIFIPFISLHTLSGLLSISYSKTCFSTSPDIIKQSTAWYRFKPISIFAGMAERIRKEKRIVFIIVSPLISFWMLCFWQLLPLYLFNFFLCRRFFLHWIVKVIFNWFHAFTLWMVKNKHLSSLMQAKGKTVNSILYFPLFYTCKAKNA